MKKVLTSVMVIGTLAAWMTACKKEVPPGANSSADLAAISSARGGDDSTIAVPKTYQLTKRGTDTLLYYNDGRLAKVQHSPSSYTQYTYGFNTVTAKKYSGVRLDEEILYQIDLQNDRVMESEWKGYSYYTGGTVTTKKTHKYEYLGDGHLFKKYNKAYPAERAKFSWAGDNISQIRYYDKDNQEYAIMQYTNVWNASKLRMHSPSTGLDIYLNKFGKPSKQWAGFEQKFIAGSPYTTAWYVSLSYTMNSDGYPVTCEVLDMMSTPRVVTEIIDYKYKVTP